MSLSFFEKVTMRNEGGHFVCFGFDPVHKRIPSSCLLFDDYPLEKHRALHPQDMLHFCKKLIEPAAEVVGCFKPNVAFFEKYGARGYQALEELIAEMHARAPHIPIILDAKRADIGNTNEGYAEYAFDFLKVDAITVHNYLGYEAMEPFLCRADKGIIVLCKTSNPGSDEFQNLPIYHQERKPLYQQVAVNVSNPTVWNKNGNCAVVVGATYPEELLQVRNIIGDMTALIPGIGAQGGSLEMAVKAGMNSRGFGHVINTSSGAMFASTGADHVEATVSNLMELNDNIIAARGNWN